MNVTPSIAPIVAKVSVARRRLRLRNVLHALPYGWVALAGVALWSVLGARLGWWSPTSAHWAMAASFGGLLLWLGWAALRVPDAQAIARRIDRANDLADRLSTALAFASTRFDDETTEAMRHAAIADGCRVVAAASPQRAVPLNAPPHWRSAVGLCVLCLALTGLRVPRSTHIAQFHAVAPVQAPPGSTITLRGVHLGRAAQQRIWFRPGTGPGAGSGAAGPVPSVAEAIIVKWTDTAVTVRVPSNAQLGRNDIVIASDVRGQRQLGVLPFTVADPGDQRFFSPDAVVLDQVDKDYLAAVLADLKAVATSDAVPALDTFTAKIEALLAKAERGELSKAEMLAELQKAQDEFAAGTNPTPAETDAKLSEMATALATSPVTQPLAEALRTKDLSRAQAELEKLASQLDQQQLSPQQQADLAKALSAASKAVETKTAQQQQAKQQQQQQLEEEVRRLQKEKESATTPRAQQDAERRLQKKRDELQRLQNEQKQHQASAEQDALQRLTKNMKQAAESLNPQNGDKNQGSNGQNDQGQRDGDQASGQKQASGKLKDAARETGRVDSERRKMAAQKKVASQMDDLKEALRRAKQRGNKGPNNPFDQKGQGQGQGQQQDFAQRARGQRGQGQAWKPGQGGGQGQAGQAGGSKAPGQGQGQGQPGAGGDGYGTADDDDLVGQSTGKSGQTKDEDLQGVHGKGPSRRETILASAQRGFASVGYQKVYTDYKRIVEEVLRTEKVPSSYKYYVKRYFTQIHPTGSAAAVPPVMPSPSAPSPSPGAR